MIVCQKDTAVVILSYNGTKWHELFLPKIVEEANTGYDVILADNASTDGTLEYVQKNFPSVKTLQIPVNHGFANYQHAKCSCPAQRCKLVLLTVGLKALRLSSHGSIPLESIASFCPAAG